MIFNKLDDSAIGKIRPRFKLESPESMSNIMNIILEAAAKDETIVTRKQHNKYIKITIPDSEKHYWSPVLNLSCDNKEIKDKTIIRGHIGPSEDVWGIFILTYAAIAILGFFASVWAYVQWVLNKDLFYFYVIPIAIALLFSIFITSKYGQRKAHLQTLHIMRFLRRAVDKIECERVI